MKYIFDFDDVLFHKTRHFRERMFLILEKVGLSRSLIDEYSKIEIEKEHPFSLKKLIQHFVDTGAIEKTQKEKLYEEIMNESKNSVNINLLQFVKNLKRSDCYILTRGEEEFQRDKIKRSAIAHLFSKIIIVSKSKKENIEKICDEFKNETVFFIDDKAEHFENLDFQKYPNLKTILYTGQNLGYLIS